MLNTAVLIFAVAALGGLVLAMHVLRGKFAPWPVSILHALLGATRPRPAAAHGARGRRGVGATWALVALVVAALGGFYLASLHRRQTLPPKGIVLLHAGLAVVGFGLMLTVLFG